MVGRWARPPALRVVGRQAVLPVDLGPERVPPENPQHWQTPERLLSVVRLMCEREEIGLDVCSSPENPTGALRFFTEGGLARRWRAPSGTMIFCNPPFADAGAWAARAASWYGRLKSSDAPGLVLLLPLRPHRVWWRESVAAVCPWVAVVGEAVTFVGAESAAPWPIALCCYNVSRFSVWDAAASVGVPVDMLESGAALAESALAPDWDSQ